MNDQTQQSEQVQASAPTVATPTHLELAKAQWQSASPNTQRGIIAGLGVGIGVALGTLFS